ncbi:MAG TPA: CotH kinase family protein, partial [Bacilli bacterium]|nr:CotH kinase family protein [Bacilli bacterium]
NLNDYCLGKEDTSCTDNLTNVIIKSGEYYILMASGDSNLSNNTYHHLDFKIGDNDTLYLFKNKTIIDTLFIPNLDTGYSYGKSLEYGEYYYSSPTPDYSNGSGIIAISTPPTFNQVGGIYNNIENLTIKLSGEGDIYYTTNGADPTTSSFKYTEPLVLDKTTVIKAITVVKDKRNSSVSTESYIINENHTVPVVSIVVDPGKLSYLNKNAWITGITIPVYTEYFGEDGTFAISSGLKLFGGTTRGDSKKSYALKFSKEYGVGTLNYQVFANRDYATYEDLVLRTASQDENRAIIRDILGTSLVDGVTNAYVQAYKTVILYINGEYWGIYFLREKTDENYVSNNFNVPVDGTDLLRVDGEVKSGTTTAYNKLVSYINTHNLSNNEYYEYVSSLIDIDSFIDFWVAETYVTNNDIVNYRYFRNPNLDDGKWKFIFYDLDWAFYNYDKDYYSFATSLEGMTVNSYSTVLLRNLMKNADFKKRFVERVSYQLKNVWNEERINTKMAEILAELEPELERNFERWNLSEDDFEYQLGRLKTYIAKREAYMISQTKSFFNLTDEEVEYYFGE